MKKLIIKILLILAAFCGLSILSNEKVYADYDFQEISTNESGSITAKLEGNTLTISGKGAMENMLKNPEKLNEGTVFTPYVSEITNVIVDEGITKIGEYTFYELTELENIQLPNSLTEIGKEAFEWCTSLSSISIPNNVEKIGEYAFCRCSKLTSVSLSNEVTNISDGLFFGCHELTNINIPNNTKIIGKEVFSECGKIKKIELPDGVTKIGDMAFLGCSQLEDINIPNNVTSIGILSFGYCNNLEKIELPNKLIELGKSAFSCCTGLKQITIPSGIKTIESYTFDYCDSLEIIELPNTIKTIEEGAFSDCRALKNINIPTSVTSIGAYAFGGCTSLKEIYILKNVSQINDRIFDEGNNTVTVYCNNNSAVLENCKKYNVKYLVLEPEQVTGLTDSNQSQTTITLSWNQNEKTTGYQIYKYDASQGKYVRIKTTTGTSFKVRELDIGTQYRFKVRAFNEIDGTRYYGEFCEKIKVSTLPYHTKITSLTTKNNKVTLQWKRVKGITGYAIYMSTNKYSGYTKIKTINGEMTTSYTTPKLNNNQKYYFKVRSFVKVSGKKYYSQYSNVLKIKVKN